jgi:hypothetical protein
VKSYLRELSVKDVAINGCHVKRINQKYVLAAKVPIGTTVEYQN